MQKQDNATRKPEYGSDFIVDLLREMGIEYASR